MVFSRTLKKRGGLLVALIACTLIALSCNSGSPLFTLDGDWGYRQGFDRSWLTDHDPSTWKKITLPKLLLYPGTGTYREGITPPGAFTLRKELPPEADRMLMEHRPLVLYVADLTGHRVDYYLNNALIGSVGSIGPEKPAMSRDFLGLLPAATRANAGVNALFIVFNIHGFDRVSHGIYEIPVIDDPLSLYGRYERDRIIEFILLTLYLCIGIIFLILGVRLPNSLYSLYFGLFSLCFTCFEMSNLGCRELIFGDDVLLRLKIDQASLKMMIAFFGLFITLLFVRKHTKAILVLTAYCVVLAVCDAFRGLEYNLDDKYNFWLPAVLFGFCYVIFILAREVVRKNIDALILIAGVAIFTVTSVQNILVDIHLIHQKAIPLHYTTLVIFLSVVLMLINRYVTIHKELADLNSDLEHKVDQRTRELQTASEKIIWMKRKEKFIHSFDLTTREKKILELIMEGLSVNDICLRLDISFRTVNNHVYNMYRKMGVHSRMEIIANLDRMAE